MSKCYLMENGDIRLDTGAVISTIEIVEKGFKYPSEILTYMQQQSSSKIVVSSEVENRVKILCETNRLLC